MAARVTILLLSILAAQCSVPAATQQCARVDPALVAAAKPTYISYFMHVAALKELLEINNHLITCAFRAATACIKEEPMGMEDGRIPDSSLTASSSWNEYHGPEMARLNTHGSYNGAWRSGLSDQNHPWIQVDFQKKVHMTGVITQGQYNILIYMREYQVAFSQDASKWTNVADAEGAAITFTGNTDGDTEVTNRFPAVVTARYLRIYPTKWHYYPSMRFEVTGCGPTS